MKTLIRLEEVALFLFSIFLFVPLGFPWWYFPVLLFAPDVSLAAYLAGPRVGAWVYNFVHHRGLALVYYVVGTAVGMPLLALAGIVCFAHSSLDRVMGYGLKYPDSFANTHLGQIGRQAPH